MPDGVFGTGPQKSVSLVLAGGVALGAYEAGAYAALHEHVALRPEWLAGSSIGAVNAAIIAGNPVDRRIERLQQFWGTTGADPFPISSFWMGGRVAGPFRQAQNEAAALGTLLFGRSGLFRPRLAPGAQAGVQDMRALFDLAPLRQQLVRLVDFDLINRGDIRLSLSCTDVVSGDRVVFDNKRGDQIGPEHVLASSALLPILAPIEVEGRLLGDGCLGANTPLDLVLDGNPDGEVLCFVVELFARQGSRPHTLAAAANRAADLAFSNQTRRILEGRQREFRLRGLIGQLAARLPVELREDADVAAILAEGRTERVTIATVAYRAGLDEAGLFKMFDFSLATLSDRWGAGEAAMRDAVAAVSSMPGSSTSTLAVIDT